MPRHYSMGGRAGASTGGPTGGPGIAPAGPPSLRARFGALRNLSPLLKLIWPTSAAPTGAELVRRLVRALPPVATLDGGKLIIDEVVRLAQTPGVPISLRDWLSSGLLVHLGWL